MAQIAGQPIFILPEGALRTTGRDAQRQNIMAARAVAEAIRTTLGPKGMDKMLVDDLGDVTITNDGATIVDEMNVEHPAAKMVVEVAKTQDDEVGDGTTTAVVLTGELLANAEKLLDQGIHSTVIARGYRMAANKAQEILRDIGNKITLKDRDLLKKYRTSQDEVVDNINLIYEKTDELVMIYKELAKYIESIDTSSP